MEDHKLYVEDRFIQMYRRGEKDIEARIGFRFVRQVAEVGYKIRFETSTTSVLVKVTGVREYASVEDLISCEDPSRIFPWTNRGSFRTAWRQMYKLQDEVENGIVVMEVELVEE
jgi:ASC-1-like (ASCH) protein